MLEVDLTQVLILSVQLPASTMDTFGFGPAVLRKLKLYVYHTHTYTLYIYLYIHIMYRYDMIYNHFHDVLLTLDI
jgi:hypothetical protein